MPTRHERASKHAKRSHKCSICGKVCFGNGGWFSHKAMHLRKAGLPPGHNWVNFVQQIKSG